MPAQLPAQPISNPSLTLTFAARELAQLEAFATLHGLTVAAFVHRAALEAANITPAKKSATGNASDPGALGALWLTESFASASHSGEAPGLVAPFDATEEPNSPESTPFETVVEAVVSPKRGVAGEPSGLAKGHGLVWDIRRALGRERVHGLGWTREQLAFVLKLSVVGVRKMEHLGTSPVKSLESRKALLTLAKTLETPSPEIYAYIEGEETALG